MLPRAESYEALVEAFRWEIPDRFNIAVACCDRWAAAVPDRVALIRYGDRSGQGAVTFADLKRDSDRLAHALRHRGVAKGDRLALLLPQSTEAAVGHLAAYKLGAIVVPLAALFGPDALAFRLRDSGARAIVTDAAGAGRLAALRDDLPDLETVLCVDGPDGGAVEGYRQALEPFVDPFPVIGSGPDDPAMMIYTSGTTGPPKGALHGHRVLLGHLPGFSLTHEFAPEPDDRAWTPSDWAWAGGLLNALLPALYFGTPVVFGPFRRFDPEAAFAMMAEAGIRNVFLPPTAIKLMEDVERPLERFDIRLRTVTAAGESLGRSAFERAEATFGRAINEFYGQTECNYVLGSCAALGVSRAGAVGKPIPGHGVSVIGEDGVERPPGEAGEIAIRRGDPSMFLEYWRQPDATGEKFRGDWMLTGDQAVRDADGYVHFIGRNDDVITSAGYRIGPGEVEDCLATHPAVRLSAVVGKPDPVRTEIVSAFVALKPGYEPGDKLAEDIRRHVRERLSAAEYPREVAFVDEIPLTTSGKVIRRGFRARVRGGSGGAGADQVLPSP
ncbi:MAG: AMP-binding protein [Bauldia sp.]|uniref:AMP-binding protein n=1 Tax=Bauldia sp. TaxID=2575872 RepID=UPI001DD1B17E|nr:AMP-binding protein [Bauldia sp.]MCB1494668.1 AMP-binding protein [Bauldia sp.]